MSDVGRDPGWDDQGQTSLLSELSEDVRQEILGAATPVRVRAGEWLFRTGDAADAMFILRSGRVEVYAGSGDGGLGRLLRVLGPGAALGEIGLLTGLPRSACVRARRDSALLRVDAGTFADLLQRRAGLALALSRAMGLALAKPGDGGTAGVPLVKLVALTPVSGGRPMPVVVDAMVRALRELRPPLRVAVIDEDAARAAAAELGLDAHTSPSERADRIAAELDRLENSHDALLVVTGSLTSTDADSRSWTELCLRSADRSVLVVGPDDDPRDAAAGVDRATSLVAGRIDVCFLGTPDSAHLTGWLDALHPRGHHLVRLDTNDSVAETVGRMTRRIVGRSVGVVLSGGGARGFAHIGVLSTLEAAGIRIDRVGGCSIGAIMGALFAAGRSYDDLMEIARRDFIRGKPLNDYTVPRAAILKGEKMATALRAVLGSALIEALPRPFFCMSADLVRAEPVVHRRGSVWTAVLASASIPGLLPPVPVDGRLLVDGGVLNNLPIDVMADDAEGPVIAVDVMRPFSRGAPAGPRTRRLRDGLRQTRDADGGDGHPLPPIAETLARATVLGSWRTAERNRHRAALTITVPDDGTGLFAWDRLDALVAAGRQAAEEALRGSDGIRG
jgi:NTE family protein